MCCDLEHVSIVNSRGKVRPKGETVSGLDFDYEVRSLGRNLNDELYKQKTRFFRGSLSRR